MISVLIPVYNYDVVPLVREMHRQASQLDFPFEILVLDDNSTDPNLERRNLKIVLLPNVYYLRSTANVGRSATRKKLAEEATYNWLLFLDADMFPVTAEFFKRYAEKSDEAELIFGGISYEKKKPKGKELRWKYGRQREEQSVKKRAEKPYLSVLSGVILIKKALFEQANDFLENRYGLDVLFTANLEHLRPNIFHIENPALHKGLESNAEFIAKTEKAMQSIAFFANSGRIAPDHRGIQQMALRLKKYRLIDSFLNYTGRFERQILKNLHSKNPSLRLFDLYRLRILIQNLNSHA